MATTAPWFGRTRYVLAGSSRQFLTTCQFGVPFDDLDDGDRFGWKVGAADYRKDVCSQGPFYAF